MDKVLSQAHASIKQQNAPSKTLAILRSSEKITGLLVGTAKSMFCVPVMAEIHEGVLKNG